MSSGACHSAACLPMYTGGQAASGTPAVGVNACRVADRRCLDIIRCNRHYTREGTGKHVRPRRLRPGPGGQTVGPLCGPIRKANLAQMKGTHGGSDMPAESPGEDPARLAADYRHTLFGAAAHVEAAADWA